MKRACSEFYQLSEMFNSEQHVTLKENKFRHMKALLKIIFVLAVSMQM